MDFIEEQRKQIALENLKTCTFIMGPKDVINPAGFGDRIDVKQGTLFVIAPGDYFQGRAIEASLEIILGSSNQGEDRFQKIDGPGSKYYLLKDETDIRKLADLGLEFPGADLFRSPGKGPEKPWAGRT